MKWLLQYFASLSLYSICRFQIAPNLKIFIKLFYQNRDKRKDKKSLASIFSSFLFFLISSQLFLSMSSSLIENLPLDSSKDCKDASCNISSKPRRSWKQFIHRRNGKRVYVCNADSCGKAFNYLSSLVKHERIHRGERPYTCKVCQQSFVQSSNLKRHERTHTGEKTFECNQCQKKFSTASNLRQHLQIHSDEFRRKHYDCEQCGRSYLYPSSLNKHAKFCDGTKPLETTSTQTSLESKIEPMLKKQVKIEEKIEEALTVNDQKSQPESPTVNVGTVTLSPIIPKLIPQNPQSSSLTMSPFMNSYPVVEPMPSYSYPTIQTSRPLISSQDQFLNRLLLQRTAYSPAPSLYQQNVKQFVNPTVNLMGMNELPSLLYQRQKMQNTLLQRAAFSLELGRLPLF